MTSNNWY